MVRRSVGLILVLLSVMAVPAGAATAQESATVIISGPLLASPIPDRGGPTWAQFLGSITVLADGERCTTADLLRHVSDTDYPLTIGAPAQPEACSQEGAALTFEAQKGNHPAIPLDATFTLTQGATFTLDSFAPLPPPLGEPAQMPEGEAFANVRFPQDLLDHVPNPWQDDAPTLGEIWQTMSVYANGERCGVVDTAATEARNAAGDLLFAIGTAEQPGPCRTEGALVTFHRGDHPVSMMALMLWLERDATLVFNDSSGGIEDPPVIRPDGPPAPPLVGTGLQSAAGSDWAPWIVVSGVVLAAASVGSFWVARRTS